MYYFAEERAIFDVLFYFPESKMETESTEKKREIPPVVNGLNHDHITSIIR